MSDKRANDFGAYHHMIWYRCKVHECPVKAECKHRSTNTPTNVHEHNHDNADEPMVFVYTAEQFLERTAGLEPSSLGLTKGNTVLLLQPHARVNAGLET
jgi:hypothetical protein